MRYQLGIRNLVGKRGIETVYSEKKHTDKTTLDTLDALRCSLRARIPNGRAIFQFGPDKGRV
jgi:hypothetical protein